MSKKILVRFAGEAKRIMDIESFEAEIKEDDLTILDFLKEVLKEKAKKLFGRVKERKIHCSP